MSERDAIVTDADREALEAIDDALGFLMDNELAIVLQAFARHRAAHSPVDEVARLREALRPFANYRGSDEYLKSAPDDGLCQAASFTAGDYRAARKALDTRP